MDEDTLLVEVWLDSVDSRTYQHFSVPISDLKRVNPENQEHSLPEQDHSRAGSIIAIHGARADVRVSWLVQPGAEG